MRLPLADLDQHRRYHFLVLQGHGRGLALFQLLLGWCLPGRFLPVFLDGLIKRPVFRTVFFWPRSLILGSLFGGQDNIPHYLRINLLASLSSFLWTLYGHFQPLLSS